MFWLKHSPCKLNVDFSFAQDKQCLCVSPYGKFLSGETIIREIFDYGIRNQGFFSCRIWNPGFGIRNLAIDWNFGIQVQLKMNLESDITSNSNPECGIQNPRLSWIIASICSKDSHLSFRNPLKRSSKICMVSGKVSKNWLCFN